MTEEDTYDTDRKFDTRMGNMKKRMGDFKNMISEKLNKNEPKRQEENPAMKRIVLAGAPSRIPVPMQPTGAGPSVGTQCEIPGCRWGIMRDDSEIEKMDERRKQEELPAMTIAQSLRLMGPAGPCEDRSVTPFKLWRIMGSDTEIEQIDMKAVEDSQAKLSSSDRAKAKQVVGSIEFRSWLTSNDPGDFLLHGHAEVSNGVSALSTVCSILTTVLRQRNSHLAVTHFCGRSADPQGLGLYYTMVRSFVSQLFRHPTCNTNDIQYNVDLTAVRRGQLAQVWRPFGWLVSQLPAGTTLVCIIDEITNYEGVDAVHGAFGVMDCISLLNNELKHRMITIKIFATSTIADGGKLRKFYKDASILDFSTVSGSGNVGIDDVYRELEAGFTD